VKKYIYWILRIVPALIMFQTLYFKFTAHPQSVHLFTILGLEPYGRIGIGIGELIAVILILIPRTTILGALMGVGLMSGAIFSHITKLGIVFEGDAILFTYAVVTLICCAILVYLHKYQIPGLLKFKI
jgi:uncharacterized membrane protein YphA (DoxX/SURF4 family)